MITQKERFLKYLQTCVKSTRATDSNPLLLGGNAPKDYTRFLESDRLFDYNPSKWENTGSMYNIKDFETALEIFNELINDDGFIKRDKNDNQGWRRGAISHYVCFLSAEKFFKESNLNQEFKADSGNGVTHASPLDLPLQQIFYGAPGTGKSFAVDDVCKRHAHIRTTFHPDSDYSTFVGCYKPTMINAIKVYSAGELISKLTEIKNTGTSYPCHKFSTMYWESLKNLSATDIKSILTACGFTESMNVEVLKGVAIGQYMVNKADSKKITYSFTPQAFTNAYIKAWEDLSKPVFLVIEEINRGNCAQIFGDLFQLLDRKDNGYSSYEIEPNTDLGNYIKGQGLNIEGVKDSDGKDISNKLMSGELMTLPPNLHIWATMNTSDQSLFPIDSAFKRRWDWKYVPIKYANKDWKVVLKNGSSCKWTELQTILNDLIYDATESEDKMLGDWFVKADEKNIISEEVLVGKIIFYLWNDVAKVDAGKLFDLEVEKNGRKRKVIFSDFYNTDETIKSENVKSWLKKIGVTLTEKGHGNNAQTKGLETDSAENNNATLG